MKGGRGSPAPPSGWGGRVKLLDAERRAAVRFAGYLNKVSFSNENTEASEILLLLQCFGSGSNQVNGS